MRLAAAVAALALVAPPAAAQNAIDIGWLATTYCASHRPFTTTAPMLDSVTSIAVAAHEAAHRRRMAAGCDSVKALWARDPVARLDAEAEGYCAGLGALELPPGSRLLELVKILERLKQMFVHAPEGDVAAAVARYCLPLLQSASR
ncbi:MAG: hypothetical protein ACREIB_00220 [Pseudomonadota bacterium]